MKASHRMSIDHLLCKSQDKPSTSYIASHGMPSPVSCYSGDDSMPSSPIPSRSSSSSTPLSPSQLSSVSPKTLHGSMPATGMTPPASFYYASPMPVVLIARSRHAPARRAMTPTRMAWSLYEDELLTRGYALGLSWAMISSTYLPHRSRGCCWGRFKTLQQKKVLTVTKQRSHRIKTKPWKAFEPDNE
ncbi:hypothetical protein BC940DRAFT_301815 [Gongronella butleri]|nr:hypothetical protein BC940DRAFT_301815 [Gongronella butleri]